MNKDEDYLFMKTLRASRDAEVLTVAVPEAEGICAHTYHPQVSISGGERVDEGRFTSSKVKTPEA
eukprot:CAMPEP_0171268972 /NCGR_PEP_ID=MMETSP0790-20130122/59950_1 /TAXON_ID=2925 /ORGANISM="Alexandrium catenella, Strain OF101" /LENGTH=64 /DNA_ID=CAMNT_0011737757 /DNA_START=25 /DNA_END=215 /DNA_ORIENTATION=+